MEFRIADTFTAALGKLTRDEQKAVKNSVFDLQTNPTMQGLQLHRIDASKDRNFWSVRVNRDIRIVVHKTEASLLLAYVDHHDDAYKWAERRRIEAHPKTGAVQIVEVRERVEEIARSRGYQESLDLGHPTELPLPQPAASKAKPELQPFTALSRENLLSVGVPDDWMTDILVATEDQFLELATHLPDEASEALLEYVSSGTLKVPAPVVVADPFAHPDTLRRIRVVENAAELEQALSFPWERWIVFLHPSQQAIVEQAFAGPARVSGSAGTGKTVVAIHRARWLATSNPNTRVLFATLSDPLAFSLERKLEILAGGQSEVIPRITVASFVGIARELFQLVHARKPAIASEELIRGLLLKSAEAESTKGLTERFLMSEWRHGVDAWQVKTAQAYAELPRHGRKSRVGVKNRERLWPIFDRVIKNLERRGFLTDAGVYQALTEHYASRAEKPFTHAVIDEAQDLGVPELPLHAGDCA